MHTHVAWHTTGHYYLPTVNCNTDHTDAVLYSKCRLGRQWYIWFLSSIWIIFMYHSHATTALFRRGPFCMSKIGLTRLVESARIIWTLELFGTGSPLGTPNKLVSGKYKKKFFSACGRIFFKFYTSTRISSLRYVQKRHFPELLMASVIIATWEVRLISHQEPDPIILHFSPIISSGPLSHAKYYLIPMKQRLSVVPCDMMPYQNHVDGYVQKKEGICLCRGVLMACLHCQLFWPLLPTHGIAHEQGEAFFNNTVTLTTHKWGEAFA